MFRRSWTTLIQYRFRDIKFKSTSCRHAKMEVAHCNSKIKKEEDYSNITLRPYDPTDLDNFTPPSNDEIFIKYPSWYPITYDSEEKRENHLIWYNIPHPWYKAIFLQNRVIGDIEVVLNVQSKEGCRAEVGYEVEPEFRGKGIMTRAMKMAVPTIFKDLPGLKRLEAVVDVKNLASQRVVEKVGFQREGILRRYYLDEEGKPMDMVMFSLLHDDPSLKSLMCG